MSNVFTLFKETDQNKDQKSESEINDFLEEQFGLLGSEYMKIDGFDKAIIGICSRPNCNHLLAYDYNKMIKILMDDGFSEEDAEEYISYNIEGAWMGELTPFIVYTL
jgi:hypothetical protein